MQDTVSDIISLQFNKHSVEQSINTFYNLFKRYTLYDSANIQTMPVRSISIRYIFIRYTPMIYMPIVRVCCPMRPPDRIVV
jgi:hypothetical protein